MKLFYEISVCVSGTICMLCMLRALYVLWLIKVKKNNDPLSFFVFSEIKKKECLIFLVLTYAFAELCGFFVGKGGL